MLNSLSKREKRKDLHKMFEQIMLSGQYAEGQFSKTLEEELSTKTRKAVTFNSCGSALYAMFKYYAKQGHRTVAVQNNTFYATGAAAIAAGLRLVLVDSRSDCPAMSLESLKEAYKLGVDLVCITHIGGFIAKDYYDICVFCKEKGITLVEDCAHSLGNGFCGTRGEASCYSFYATKALPAGEGGALCTFNPDLAGFATRFKQYSKEVLSGQVVYDTQILGMNLRMSEWDSAVALMQWRRRWEIMEARGRDELKLQSIAPCLLSGPTNYYKYPVSLETAKGMKQAGKVYREEDQLFGSLPKGSPLRCVSLSNSLAWAKNHACLPIGEGLYDGIKTKKDLMQLLGWK